MFLRQVDELDLLTNTVIVVGSDHGEAFEEHGFEGHARNLYNEVTAVPLIFILPFVLEKGIEVDATIANVDIWPTLLDMIGLPPMENIDGVSQLPLVLEAGGASALPLSDGLRRPIFSQLDRRWGNAKADPDPLVSVVDENARVIIPLGSPEKAEFYDMKTDRREQTDLAADRADELAPYRALVDEYLADDQPPWGVAPGIVELEEMQLNQLKALGYKIEN